MKPLHRSHSLAKLGAQYMFLASLILFILRFWEPNDQCTGPKDKATDSEALTDPQFINSFCTSENYWYNARGKLGPESEEPRYAYFKTSYIVFGILGLLLLSAQYLWEYSENEPLITLNKNRTTYSPDSSFGQTLALVKQMSTYITRARNFGVDDYFAYTFCQLYHIAIVSSQVKFMSSALEFGSDYGDMFHWMRTPNYERTDPLSQIFPAVYRCKYSSANKTAAEVLEFTCVCSTNFVSAYLHVVAMLLLIFILVCIVWDCLGRNLSIHINFKRQESAFKRLNVHQKHRLLLIGRIADSELWEDVISKYVRQKDLENI